jgi:hypothetical protein
MVLLQYFHVSHRSTYLYWSLEKFHEVWSQKSHEMISYILVGMTLLSAIIALLSGWKYRSSTKPCNLAQMTLDGLYNKSCERFVLSKCLENAPMDQKG